ncbi:hypothetical protein [Streptomyces sp. NPDC046939]|uniref:hypothetical protein n=1 Tax=Streptomyces sp. NPDC046939 TaxID=3155376 RepID=UPI00340B350D
MTHGTETPGTTDAATDSTDDSGTNPEPATGGATRVATRETDPASDAATGTTAEDSGGGAPVVMGRWRRWIVGGVAGGAVLVALAGGVLFWQAQALRDSDAARNSALTDVEATTRVSGDVGSALAKVFSYTPDGTDATERSARTVLAGQAARQYAELFQQVRANARGQHVSLTTRTVRVGTVDLRGSTAHLLVFLDQTARRGGKKPATSAAQLSVTARLHDDVWQIVDIKAR